MSPRHCLCRSSTRADERRTRSLRFQDGWKRRMFGRDEDSTRILRAVLRVRVRGRPSPIVLHNRGLHSERCICAVERGRESPSCHRREEAVRSLCRDRPQVETGRWCGIC